MTSGSSVCTKPYPSHCSFDLLNAAGLSDMVILEPIPLFLLFLLRIRFVGLYFDLLSHPMPCLTLDRVLLFCVLQIKHVKAWSHVQREETPAGALSRMCHQCQRNDKPRVPIALSARNDSALRV